MDKQIHGRQEIENRFLATVACKAAIKGNKELTDMEIKSLLDEILKFDIKDSRKIIDTFNAIMEAGKDIDYISDYELRFLIFTVDLIEVFFRVSMKKMEEK